MIPGSTNQLMAAGGGYQIQRSLRFRSSASAYLSRTPGASGDLQKFTQSLWVKRGALGVATLLNAYNGGATTSYFLKFNASDNLQVYSAVEGVSTNWNIVSTQVFRDPSAWYHIVCVLDTANATASERVKLYVNGVQITSLGTASYPAQNFNNVWNSSGYAHNVSRSSEALDGYVAELINVGGQALTPSSFGQTDPSTGQWVAKKYTGTYGTNGFYLDFRDPTSTTTLCADRSGNGNNWTATNISLSAGATYDSMLDVPSGNAGMSERGNYCTLNPLDLVGAPAISDANLTAYTGTTTANVRGTMAVTSGKWYWEVTAGTFATAATHMVGVCDANVAIASSAWGSANAWTYYANNGNKYNNGSNSAYGATWTTGDVIGIALDMDAGTLTFYKNGVSQGVAYSGLSGKALTSCFGSAAYTLYCHHNFGQRPFAYTPPTGFKALHTGNLPQPTIRKPALHFDAKTYTGNGTSLSVGGIAFRPDLVWVKDRVSGANGHRLVDSVRGATLGLKSHATDAEATETNGLTAFNSDGFSVGSQGDYNAAEAFISWNWKAGGAAVTNNAGSISSQVSANTAAGFSIVTGTYPSAPCTVGHSLGVSPAMIVAKRRGVVDNWFVWHKSLPVAAQSYLILNSTSIYTNSTTLWNNVAPTASVFSLGGGFGSGNDTFVAYCFAEVPGFSKFGSYTGNGSADGPFVYCGFRPRWVMIKRSDGAGGQSWVVNDSARDPYNVGGLTLLPNSSGAEIALSGNELDFTSTGFKIRNSGGDRNTNGGTYIFAAFAEAPFNYANAR